MVTLTEKDKKYIENTEGTVLARAAIDHLTVLERKHGKKVKGDIKREMENVGYSLDTFKIKPAERIPTSHYMAFFVVEKQLFNLDDEGIREMGRETAKMSFLLRFASSLLISIETLCKNSNVAWNKYYRGGGGELYITELKKEEKILRGELRNFLGHPIHCRYMEGYFGQVVSLVAGGEAKCREEKCPFSEEESNVHRFMATWK